jgi:protein O-GlcNAc transferase
MTTSEAAFFLHCLKDCSSYFEFGCGGSTKFAAAFGPKNMKITSVDSSLEWINKVKQDERCVAKISRNELQIDHVDIGPIGAWGRPLQTVEESKGAWYLYSQAITLAGEKYDVVLVDGRFRVACVLNTFLVNPTADVLIHDFVETEYHHHDHYKILLSVADVAERVGTLVKLKRKSSVPKAELMKMYAAHINTHLRI